MVNEYGDGPVAMLTQVLRQPVALRLAEKTRYLVDLQQESNTTRRMTACSRTSTCRSFTCGLPAATVESPSRN
jgi:hypothetical protein